MVLFLYNYNSINVIYDELNRPIQVSYYFDASKNDLLVTYQINYTSNGHPIFLGQVFYNHQFNISNASFEIVTSSISSVDNNFNLFGNVLVPLSNKFTMTNPNKNEFDFSAPAGNISIVSNSVEDNSSGSGASSLEIIGLDENFFNISETINLNGTTPVISNLNWLRINSAQVTSLGNASSGLTSNIGEINITRGLNSLATILSNRGIAYLGMYTTPQNCRLYISSLNFTGYSNDEYRIQIFERKTNPICLKEFIFKGSLVIDNDIMINEKTDFYVLMKREKGSLVKSQFYYNIQARLI